MAIDLHTRLHTSLPQNKQPQHDHDHLTLTLPPSRHHHNINHSSSALKNPPHALIPPHQSGSNVRTTSTLPLPPRRFTEEQGIVVHNEDQDFVAELTRQMTHFMLQQNDDEFNFSRIGSRNSESPWDSSSIMGSAPGNSRESCWESTYDAVGMFEKTRRTDERSDSCRYHHGCYYGTQSQCSNVGTCSRQSLIHEQIRAIEVCRVKQEQILALKQKVAAYNRELVEGKIMQFQKKGNNNGNGRIHDLLHQQPPCSEMQPSFLGGSDSRAASCGTGVFLPRPTINASSHSPKRPGKGCSNILIPARVVQALQLHFDQMAATSGPKPAAFPPLHDVLVSNRDGMYSLQKRQSRKPPANMQRDMILPHEWTY